MVHFRTSVSLSSDSTLLGLHWTDVKKLLLGIRGALEMLGTSISLHKKPYLIFLSWSHSPVYLIKITTDSEPEEPGRDNAQIRSLGRLLLGVIEIIYSCVY